MAKRISYEWIVEVLETDGMIFDSKCFRTLAKAIKAREEWPSWEREIKSSEDYLSDPVEIGLIRIGLMRSEWVNDCEPSAVMWAYLRPDGSLDPVFHEASDDDEYPPVRVPVRYVREAARRVR